MDGGYEGGTLRPRKAHINVRLLSRADIAVSKRRQKLRHFRASVIRPLRLHFAQIPFRARRVSCRHTHFSEFDIGIPIRSVASDEFGVRRFRIVELTVARIGLCEIRTHRIVGRIEAQRILIKLNRVFIIFFCEIRASEIVVRFKAPVVRIVGLPEQLKRRIDVGRIHFEVHLSEIDFRFFVILI